MSSATIEPEVTTETPVPAVVEQAAPPERNIDLSMARSIAGNMVAVYVTVKRPTARPKAKGAEIEVKNDKGDGQVELKTEDVTAPCWKADKFHPIWAEIDTTKTKVDKILKAYSANDSQKGEHLVSITRVGEMINKLDQVRAERREMVQRLQSIWDTEILPGIREKKPDVAEQIIAGLPSKYGLMSAFDIIWTLRPLTPMSGNDLDLSALSADDARRVVERTNSMIDDAFKQRFANIFDDIFGAVAAECEKIEKDGLGGGRCQQSSIDAVLSVLDRVKNFSQFASPEVLSHIQNVRSVLSSAKPQDINKYEDVRNGIREAIRPLAKAVEELTTQAVGGGRSARSINI